MTVTFLYQKSFIYCNGVKGLDDNKEIIRLLNELNSNIKMLSRITAYSMKKENPNQGKKRERLQEQVAILDGLDLPDDIIALILGSTPGSVRNARLKSKKAPKPVLAPSNQPGVKTDEQQHL